MCGSALLPLPVPHANTKQTHTKNQKIPSNHTVTIVASDADEDLVQKSVGADAAPSIQLITYASPFGDIECKEVMRRALQGVHERPIQQTLAKMADLFATPCGGLSRDARAMAARGIT